MKKGFTIVELLVYTAIFTTLIIAFMGIFVVVARIQSNQSASLEVESQSQFLLQQVQNYVQQASVIDMPPDVATTTLILRMPNPAQDPTYIELLNGVVYLQQTTTGTLQALSSNQVKISNLTFTKRANTPAHDSVSVAMTIAYNTSNLQQIFSQAFQMSVARVAAATFDSNLLPSSTNIWSLGSSGNTWNNVNGLIQFNGNNVGIGAADTPQQQLEVAGGIRMNTNGVAQPGCSAVSSTEGTFWFTQNGGSSSDTLQLCVRGANAYQWVKIY